MPPSCRARLLARTLRPDGSRALYADVDAPWRKFIESITKQRHAAVNKDPLHARVFDKLEGVVGNCMLSCMTTMREQLKAKVHIGDVTLRPKEGAIGWSVQGKELGELEDIATEMLRKCAPAGRAASHALAAISRASRMQLAKRPKRCSL